MRHTFRRLLAALLTLALLPLVALSTQAAPANAVPGGFTEHTVFSRLDQPISR